MNAQKIRATANKNATILLDHFPAPATNILKLIPPILRNVYVSI